MISPMAIPAKQVLADGLLWTVEPPVSVDYGATSHSGYEFGGMELMHENQRYYAIGGGMGPGNWSQQGYSMWTLRTARGAAPTGPYEVDTAAYRLSGQGGWQSNFTPAYGSGTQLACWCRNYDTYPAGKLISQYIQLGDALQHPHVWMLPFRKPVVDDSDHLHLAYWSGNDGLKGQELIAPRILRVVSGPDVAAQYLPAWDQGAGVVVTGTMEVSGAGAAGVSVCPVHSSPSSSCTLMLIDIIDSSAKMGREQSRITTTRVLLHENATDTAARTTLLDTTRSRFECGKNKTTNVTAQCGVATVTHIEDGARLAFVLLARLGCFELYLGDDLILVQTAQVVGAAYPVGTATIGPAMHGVGEIVWSNISAWQMSRGLPPPS
eukprot:COSAG06_NODE_745_length_12649_cov_128.650916_18_plen_379_part_00